jgi:hypothetical protein
MSMIHESVELLLYQEASGKATLEIRGAHNEGSYVEFTPAQLQALAVDLNAHLAGPGREHLTHNAGGVANE